jgi:hypothetical protein
MILIGNLSAESQYRGPMPVLLVWQRGILVTFPSSSITFLVPAHLWNQALVPSVLLTLYMNSLLSLLFPQDFKIATLLPHILSMKELLISFRRHYEEASFSRTNDLTHFLFSLPSPLLRRNSAHRLDKKTQYLSSLHLLPTSVYSIWSGLSNSARVHLHLHSWPGMDHMVISQALFYRWLHFPPSSERHKDPVYLISWRNMCT